jgi:hypothetical protein
MNTTRRVRFIALFAALIGAFHNQAAAADNASHLHVQELKKVSPIKAQKTERLIIQLTASADREKFDRLLQELHGKWVRSIEFGPRVSFMVIEVEAQRLAQAERKFKADKDIALVQRNLVCHPNGQFGHGFHPRFRLFKGHYRFYGPPPPPPLSALPNDPFFSTQWNLSAMNFAQARQLGQASSAVAVPLYFLDTGMTYFPSELGAGAVQFNCFDPSNQFGVQEALNDSGTHGTGTTTVTAMTDNATGYAGAANLEGSRCLLVMCRITNGGINTATVEAVLSGLSFIYNTPWCTAGPINVSVGSTPPATLNSMQVVQTACQQLRQKGFLVVLAAGNDGLYDSSPELYARRVSAVAQDGSRASFSNYGNFATAAPGVDVPVYTPGGLAVPYSGSGTSFAAPAWCAAIVDVLGALPASLRTAPYADAIVTATSTPTSDGLRIPNLAAAVQWAKTAH